MNRNVIQFSIALILLALVVAGYYVAYTTTRQIGDQIAQIEQEMRYKSDEAQDIREARNALVALAENEARVQGYFIPKAQVVPFLEEIGSRGDAFGAEVTVVNVNEQAAGERATLSVAIQVSGTFDAVMRTIGTLEFAPYDITLSGLTLDATDLEAGGLWNGTATYTIGIQTP